MNILSDEIIRDVVSTAYQLPLAIQDRCDIYYLLHWSGECLSHRLSVGDNYIIRDGVLFQVVVPCREYLREAKHVNRVAISFRKLAKDETGYAIIKIIYGGKPLDSGSDLH